MCMSLNALYSAYTMHMHRNEQCHLLGTFVEFKCYNDNMYNDKLMSKWDYNLEYGSIFFVMEFVTQYDLCTLHK